MAVQQPERSAKGQRKAKNRQAENASRAAKEARRRRFEHEVAVRMTHRFFRGEMPPLITLDYRYWQARRCGWDALSVEFCSTWSWWRFLHWKERAKLVSLSQFRLHRR